MTSKRVSPPKLPQLLDRKIYKTGQTRGADDDVIYQNRVSRASTVLIPYSLWNKCSAPPDGESEFENRFIVLMTPEEYFTNPDVEKELATRNLSLGENTLVFFQKRTDWDAYNPREKGWTAANRRTAPLTGQYVARVAATTATEHGEKISEGFNSTGMKGAGIRLYEYASTEIINKCRTQLESIFWLCFDSMEAVTEFGMPRDEAEARKEFCLSNANDRDLLDFKELTKMRITNPKGQTICPFCLETLSSFGFFHRVAQAMGREVHDLTVTELNLFHVNELRYGEYNHRPYNQGWGHHHCNIVVKDSGIATTLDWMNQVLKRNIDKGYFSP